MHYNNKMQCISAISSSSEFYHGVHGNLPHIANIFQHIFYNVHVHVLRILPHKAGKIFHRGLKNHGQTHCLWLKALHHYNKAQRNLCPIVCNVPLGLRPVLLNKMTHNFRMLSHNLIIAELGHHADVRSDIDLFFFVP